MMSSCTHMHPARPALLGYMPSASSTTSRHLRPAQVPPSAHHPKRWSPHSQLKGQHTNCPAVHAAAVPQITALLVVTRQVLVCGCQHTQVGIIARRGWSHPGSQVQAMPCTQCLRFHSMLKLSHKGGLTENCGHLQLTTQRGCRCHPWTQQHWGKTQGSSPGQQRHVQCG